MRAVCILCQLVKVNHFCSVSVQIRKVPSTACVVDYVVLSGQHSFLENFNKIVCWRLPPPPPGSAPSYRGSWIHPDQGMNEWGRQHTILPNSPENGMESKEFGCPGRMSLAPHLLPPPPPPPRSANAFLLNMRKVMIVTCFYGFIWVITDKTTATRVITTSYQTKYPSRKVHTKCKELVRHYQSRWTK